MEASLPKAVWRPHHSGHPRCLGACRRTLRNPSDAVQFPEFLTKSFSTPQIALPKFSRTHFPEFPPPAPVFERKGWTGGGAGAHPSDLSLAVVTAGRGAFFPAVFPKSSSKAPVWVPALQRARNTTFFPSVPFLSPAVHGACARDAGGAGEMCPQRQSPAAVAPGERTPPQGRSLQEITSRNGGIFTH